MYIQRTFICRYKQREALKMALLCQTFCLHLSTGGGHGDLYLCPWLKTRITLNHTVLSQRKMVWLADTDSASQQSWPAPHFINLERVNITLSSQWCHAQCWGLWLWRGGLRVYLVVEGEEEDEGEPICLFCPPDVSESRLRDLAWGG